MHTYARTDVHIAYSVVTKYAAIAHQIWRSKVRVPTQLCRCLCLVRGGLNVEKIIICKWIQFSRKACSTRYHEAFLAKQHGKITGRMSLFSAHGSVPISVVVHQEHVSIKTSMNNSCWQTERWSDDRSSQSLYTSGKAQCTTVSKTLGAKRPLACGYSALLGKCTFIAVVCLIQQQNWVLGTFHESN